MREKYFCENNTAFSNISENSFTYFYKKHAFVESIVFDDAETYHFDCLNLSLIGMKTHYSIGVFSFLPPIHILLDRVISHFTECSYMFVPASPLKGMMLDITITLLTDRASP